jgi:hypothetical protein
MNNAEEDIRKWQKYTDVSISVFWYTELEQKYRLDVPTRMGPKYESAITDKLFFDIDCLDKSGNINENNNEGFRRLWDYAKKNDIKRTATFTSGGFQVLLGADTQPCYYSSDIRSLCDKFQIEIDPCISLACMRRWPGSFNFGRDSKSARNTYCIGLTEDETNLSFRELVRLALKHRDGLPIYGHFNYKSEEKHACVEKRTLDRRTDFTFENSASEILEKYGYYYEDICKNIRNIMEQPRVNHYERLIVIKYLKDIIGIKYADMNILLPKLLTAQHDVGNDGSHSVEEGQPKAVYSGNAHFSPYQMKKEGYCDQDCQVCLDYMKGLVW